MARVFEQPISEGMDVFSIDGHRLGRVSRVWPSPKLRGEPFQISGGPLLPPAPGDRAEEEDDLYIPGEASSYFLLDRRAVGIPQRDLYVPYSAVDSVANGRVVLNASRELLPSLGWEARPPGLPAE